MFSAQNNGPSPLPVPEDFSFGPVPTKVGSGLTSDVWKVTHKPSSKTMALKVVDKRKLRTQHAVDCIINERECLVRCNGCPFITELHYAFQDEFRFFYAMEIGLCGSVFHLSQRLKNNRIPVSGVLFFGAQLALAVQHIQDYGIIHRDIKPENCLVRDNGYLLLSDFGMATIVQSADAPLRKFVGTPKHVCPEVCLKQQHTHAIDWWGVGATMYDMICGNAPFLGGSAEQTMELVVNSELSFPQDITDSVNAAVIDVVRKFLQKDPPLRLGARGGVRVIKQQEAFANINWNKLQSRNGPIPHCVHALVRFELTDRACTRTEFCGMTDGFEPFCGECDSTDEDSGNNEFDELDLFNRSAALRIQSAGEMPHLRQMRRKQMAPSAASAQRTVHMFRGDFMAAAKKALEQVDEYTSSSLDAHASNLGNIAENNEDEDCDDEGDDNSEGLGEFGALSLRT